MKKKQTNFFCAYGSELLAPFSADKPADFITRFKLENEDIENIDSYELLKMIGKKRGMLVSGGEIDTERAAIMLLDEFRSAKLGRITVEMPQGR